MPAVGITPFSPKGPLFSARSIVLPRNLCPLAPGLSRPGEFGWDWGWVRMVGEEGVGGRCAVRPAPGSHTPQPHRRLGLGTGEAGVARYLVAPSQPRCFPVAVLTRLRRGGQRQPLKSGQGPHAPTASLVAPGDSQLGLRSLPLGVELGFRPERGCPRTFAGDL